MRGGLPNREDRKDILERDYGSFMVSARTGAWDASQSVAGNEARAQFKAGLGKTLIAVH